MRRQLVTVLALALLMQRGAMTSDAQQARDSSGVRLVRYDARDRPVSQWRVDPMPMVVIGGAGGEGASELSAVVGVARLRDGRIVLANQSTNELRVFDDRGRHMRNVGRRGGGPGEFERLGQLLRIGDTLVGIDRNRRGEVFAPDGSLARSLPIPRFDQGQFPTYVGFFRDGSSVLLALDPPGDTSQSTLRATGSLGVRTVKGTTTLLARIPMYETRKRGAGFMPVFLGPVYRVAVLDDRVCVGWAAEWQVTCYDPTGRLRSRTRRDVVPGPVTEADKRAFRDGFLRANQGAASRDKLEETARAFPIADVRSAFGRFVAGVTNELWIGEFAISEEVFLGRTGLGSPDVPTTWSVLDREGRWIADVRLPARFELLDAGADYVAGVLRDSDDVESVVVYRLRRR